MTWAYNTVVMDAVNKPRNITYKGLTDLVTETDKMSEAAILEIVNKNFEDHLILGEEGGIIGDAASDYLWYIDPLDGTTNFAHGYPSFAVSVGVLYRGRPAAAAVVEFVGGPMCWNTRTFSATTGGGAFCNGERIQVSETNQVERSLLVTGFGYDHDDAWATNIDLFREFTDVSRGVRRLGAAAVDMCHVALGIVEAYWEYRLKPWDMAAGVLMVEEAGGAVSRMDGGKFCVFDRSVLVSNGVLHEKIAPNIRINLLNMLFLDSLPTKKVFYAMILIYIRFVSRDVILHEMHIVLQITMILSLHPLDQFWHCFLINLQN
ncbi:phosphatase IMPL1, chloroplastic isoform X1 [Arachis hypogaea]|uniref:phosphatase IMPL1, chloroplastic isoform X1 n=3 Tax=Arachis hypogaea TaxID=3818 RepID=UPI000DECCE80|nr:phosphatase IMPL1, chloroplastic isoform X1 [Arachis hypogaea]